MRAIEAYVALPAFWGSLERVGARSSDSAFRATGSEVVPGDTKNINISKVVTSKRLVVRADIDSFELDCLSFAYIEPTMADQFTSRHAIKPAAGFDASNLKGKSVVVTGGMFVANNNP